MSLRRAYTLFAPVYDLAIARASAQMRRESLARLPPGRGRVLLPGVGSGLDIPYLPPGPEYVGLDLTPAMLRRACARAAGRADLSLHVGDAMRLPYPDASFDAAVLHLILAVVPHPERLLREVERVVRPGGRVVVLDKFLRPGQRAPLRRLLGRLSRHIATRTDVVFEEVLARAPRLALTEDRPVLARGWFRRIELVRV